jgi:hypothetical protein
MFVRWSAGRRGDGVDLTVKRRPGATAVRTEYLNRAFRSVTTASEALP